MSFRSFLGDGDQMGRESEQTCNVIVAKMGVELGLWSMTRILHLSFGQ